MAGPCSNRPAGMKPFPFEPTASDAQGVIKLPAMPIASKVELSVFHPDYLPQTVESLEAINGELTSVQLTKAPSFALSLRSVGRGLPNMPSDLRVTTNLGAFTRDRDRVPGLYLPKRLSKPECHCQVVPAKYERLSFRSRLERLQRSPNFYADSGSLQSQLNFSDSQPYEINFLLRKNIRFSAS